LTRLRSLPLTALPDGFCEPDQRRSFHMGRPGPCFAFFSFFSSPCTDIPVLSSVTAMQLFDRPAPITSLFRFSTSHPAPLVLPSSSLRSVGSSEWSGRASSPPRTGSPTRMMRLCALSAFLLPPSAVAASWAYFLQALFVTLSAPFSPRP